MKSNRFNVLLAIITVLVLSGCASPPRQGGPLQAQPSMAGPPPREAEALWRQAEQAQKAGNMPSALSLWDRIIQNYPGTTLAAKSLYNAGHYHLEKGQPERALQYLDYLLYNYPQWEGDKLARLDSIRALSAVGKKKQAMKQALSLWEDSKGHSQVQVGLSMFMADAYRSDGDLQTAFDWLSAGFSVAELPEQKKLLQQAMSDLLKDLDEATVHRILKKGPSDFMRVFLEFRLAQIELQKQPSDQVRGRLRSLLAQNPSHPVAPEIQAALREAPVQQTGAPIHSDRIGVLVPLNGNYAQYGRMVLRGLGAALEEWNQTHAGQPATLVVKDAPAEPEGAIKSFEELAKDDGVLGVIGPLGTQSAKAVSPTANKWGVPMLALTQQEDEPTDNSYVLHVFLDNRELVRTLVRYCRQNLGFTRFASLYPEDRYGQRLSKIFAEEVQDQGGSLLASVPYKAKTTDFKDPIQKLMNIAKQNIPPTGVDVTPFEALFIPDQVQPVSLIAPQLPYNNVVGVTLLGTNLWGEAPLVQAGGAYVEQAIFATPFYAESQSPQVRAFREKYQSVYGVAPSYLEAQAYDALMLFLQARSASPSAGSDRASFLQSLLQVRDYQGLAGVYSFRPDGGLERNYLLLQVSNGQLVPLNR